MKTIWRLAISSLIFLGLSVHAGDIKLPDRQPALTTTSAANLGTRDDNIGLAPGAQVRAFEIKDHTGKPISFELLREKGPLLVIFYRGGWCPYCNRQIHQLTKAWPDFKARGITPVLISADKPDAAALASRTYEIPFPVLSDPELIAHDVFEVTMKLDDALIPKYKRYGINLEDWSGQNHHKFAVSSAFIVNNKGLVEWSHSSKDYKTRPSVKQLLQILDARKQDVREK